MRAKVISIAGSDSSGGAGIQADIRTMERLGVTSAFALTSVTAQSPRGVDRIDSIDPASVRAQLSTALEDQGACAIKIGMAGSAESIRTIANVLPSADIFTVCDPVVSSSSGGRLIDAPGQDVLVRELFPHAHLVTPNLAEAEAILGQPVSTDEEMENAASSLLETGTRSVLIKGGHRDGPFAQDYWTDGSEAFWMTGHRVEGSESRGTGCVLSTAIASFHALGLPLKDAMVLAKAYVSEGLGAAAGHGSGNRPVRTGEWPSDPYRFPWITTSADAGRNRPIFPPCDPPPAGLYPILPNGAWVERLASSGLNALQIRIKDPDPKTLESEIFRAIQCTCNTPTRLYVNDHWKLAIRYGAYGVHLGQDDMSEDALRCIARANLRLGLSTHSYFELARALSANPSYVAIGTLFHSTSKIMEHEPLGLELLRRLALLSPVPVVAIGGIRLEHADAIQKAGAIGMAAISEVTESPHPEETARKWCDRSR